MSLYSIVYNVLLFCTVCVQSVNFARFCTVCVQSVQIYSLLYSLCAIGTLCTALYSLCAIGTNIFIAVQFVCNRAFFIVYGCSLVNGGIFIEYRRGFGGFGC